MREVDRLIRAVDAVAVEQGVRKCVQVNRCSVCSNGFDHRRGDKRHKAQTSQVIAQVRFLSGFPFGANDVGDCGRHFVQWSQPWEIC